MGLFETLFMFFTEVIRALGYAGIFILMVLESMVAPVPSEGVMPFAGYLVKTGDFTMWGVIISSSLASIIGSLLSYYMGYYGGKPVVLKFGKYLLLDKEHLDLTEKYFNKYGEKTIFICRFVPVVRHFISIPAGIGKMNIAKFSIYTLIGATIWNTFLAYLGYWLAERWEIVHHYSSYLDYLVIIVAIVFLVYWVNKRLKAKQNTKSEDSDTV
jgi:membrane protein DedA with SNARE-associated domain